MVAPSWGWERRLKKYLQKKRRFVIELVTGRLNGRLYLFVTIGENSIAEKIEFSRATKTNSFGSL